MMILMKDVIFCQTDNDLGLGSDYLSFYNRLLYKLALCGTRYR